MCVSERHSDLNCVMICCYKIIVGLKSVKRESDLVQ